MKQCKSHTLQITLDLLYPKKYCRLEADMPVKSFLWIVRDLSHYGKENDLFAELQALNGLSLR
jgi:hypothetical protein